MYIVSYRGHFGYIKPWTAVRDGETFSQQFLTPSIIEGIEKKLFPELLESPGIHKIKRHKLRYEGMSQQQEVVQTRGWEKKKKELYLRGRSVLKRSILLNPTLFLAFDNEEDAVRASRHHVCLCRNEDILLPDAEPMIMTEDDFSRLSGYELRFGQSQQSFMVGYNRFAGGQPMYGWLEYSGMSL